MYTKEDVKWKMEKLSIDGFSCQGLLSIDEQMRQLMLIESILKGRTKTVV